MVIKKRVLKLSTRFLLFAIFGSVGAVMLRLVTLGRYHLRNIGNLGRGFFVTAVLVKIYVAHHTYEYPGNERQSCLPNQADDGIVGNLEQVLLKEGQYDEAQSIVLRVGEVLKEYLATLNLTLIDFKIEVGYDESGKMYVADEITPDIWRVRDENGNIPNQLDCSKMLIQKMGI